MFNFVIYVIFVNNFVAQINLLKQTRGPGAYFGIFPKMLVRLFWAVLILLLGYYGWLFFDARSAQNKIIQAQNKISADLREAPGLERRQELLTRQAQLSHLSGLVEGHVYWSRLLPELASSTLKTVNYKSLTASKDGGVSLNAMVPSLEDLAKYMQVFDLAEFNENFSNIRIGGFSKVQGKTSTSIQFQVRMDYNPELIKYHDDKNSDFK